MMTEDSYQSDDTTCDNSYEELLSSLEQFSTEVFTSDSGSSMSTDSETVSHSEPPIDCAIFCIGSDSDCLPPVFCIGSDSEVTDADATFNSRCHPQTRDVLVNKGSTSSDISSLTVDPLSSEATITAFEASSLCSRNDKSPSKKRKKIRFQNHSDDADDEDDYFASPSRSREVRLRDFNESMYKRVEECACSLSTVSLL